MFISQTTLDLQLLSPPPVPFLTSQEKMREKMKEEKSPDGSSNATPLLQDPRTSSFHSHISFPPSKTLALTSTVHTGALAAF